MEIFKLFKKCHQLVILREDSSGLWLAGRVVDSEYVLTNTRHTKVMRLRSPPPKNNNKNKLQ